MIAARLAAVAAAVCALAPAAAHADPGVTGFMVHGPGELRGTVTAADGTPGAGVEVSLIADTGVERRVITDKAGRYRAVIRTPGATLVAVRGGFIVAGQIGVQTVEGGLEVVEIRDTVPPQTMPRARSNVHRVPAYSERAQDANRWTRAWLMLDVDERGRVARLKLLHRPGLELDEIAVEEGFRLRFDPARDRADRPIRAFVLWTFEWPPYWWMIDRKVSLARLPGEAFRVPCAGTGGPQKIFRDCTPVDLGAALTASWRHPRAP